MLEDRSIDIWAYNLETVLAEKLETIITRTTTNTRTVSYTHLDVYKRQLSFRQHLSYHQKGL